MLKLEGSNRGCRKRKKDQKADLVITHTPVTSVYGKGRLKIHFSDGLCLVIHYDCLGVNGPLYGIDGAVNMAIGTRLQALREHVIFIVADVLAGLAEEVQRGM